MNTNEYPTRHKRERDRQTDRERWGCPSGSDYLGTYVPQFSCVVCPLVTLIDTTAASYACLEPGVATPSRWPGLVLGILLFVSECYSMVMHTTQPDSCTYGHQVVDLNAGRLGGRGPRFLCFFSLVYGSGIWFLKPGYSLSVMVLRIPSCKLCSIALTASALQLGYPRIVRDLQKNRGPSDQK